MLCYRWINIRLFNFTKENSILPVDVLWSESHFFLHIHTITSNNINPTGIDIPRIKDSGITEKKVYFSLS
jgi:hypothetical protein